MWRRLLYRPFDDRLRGSNQYDHLVEVFAQGLLLVSGSRDFIQGIQQALGLRCAADHVRELLSGEQILESEGVVVRRLVAGYRLGGLIPRHLLTGSPRDPKPLQYLGSPAAERP